MVSLSYSAIRKDCFDRDMNCYGWVADDPMRCEMDEVLTKDCRKACQLCPNFTVPESRVPSER